MPTDGADFGRTRPCYGKAFTLARDGADESVVVEYGVKGVELDIRRDGGSPAFRAAMELLVLTTNGGNRQALLSGVDTISQGFADSPLTRHIASAVERIGLSGFAEARTLSAEVASEKLVAEIAGSRCFDGMPGYLARNRTKDMHASLELVDSYKAGLPHSAALRDLAKRMRDCSPKGLPARSPKGAPLVHTIEGLDEEI